MSEILFNVITFALLPIAAMIVGAVIASFRPPGAKLRSVLQHFAAGVVFSVVAVELLPDVMHEHNVWAVTIGFALGVAVMLGIKEITGDDAETAESGEQVEAVSKAMLFAIGVDILVDGFLLGIGFAAGAKEGKLLALALAIELLSLGLALASTMTRANAPRLKIILITAGLSLLIFIGSIVGSTVLQKVSAATLEAVLSFGLAALLFLVTEELLTEAHEVPETPFITASFFAGFLLFLILGMIA